MCEDSCVLSVAEPGQDIVWAPLQERHRHGEVVALHCGGGVDRRQRGGHVQHELVVIAAVVQVMADRAHPQTQALHNSARFERDF